MYPTEAYKEAVRHANTEIFRRFNIRGPYTPGTNEHAEWLKEFDRAFKELLS